MSTESKNFVKRLTTVPEAFVDELFKFYDENTTQTDPVILLDHIAKWLQCSKIELTLTLKRTYINNIDYTIKKAPNPNHIKGVKGANNYKEILVTPDCFKRLALLSRAKKGEMVRTYFIDVETQFLKYKDQTMEGLKADIVRLKHDLNPKRTEFLEENDANGYIYILRASDEVSDLFKVGRAKDIKSRLQSYQTGHAHNVNLLYVLAVHNMKNAEKCIKSQLKEFQYRQRREVYQVPIDMLKIIVKKCNEFDGMKKEYIRRKKQTIGGDNYFAVFNKDLILPADS
jgi:phage anti-repressor protein/RNase P subunit RPR2